MPKKDLPNFFIDEIYSSPPKKNYETNIIVYNQIDEIWSIDLADFSDYKTLNNKGYRYILIIIDIFSKNVRGVLLKNKSSQSKANAFSNILTRSKRSPVKLESDSGSEWYSSIFQSFLKIRNFHHHSRFTDKGPSLVERVIRTL